MPCKKSFKLNIIHVKIIRNYRKTADNLAKENNEIEMKTYDVNFQLQREYAECLKEAKNVNDLQGNIQKLADDVSSCYLKSVSILWTDIFEQSNIFFFNF